MDLAIVSPASKLKIQEILDASKAKNTASAGQASGAQPKQTADHDPEVPTKVPAVARQGAGKISRECRVSLQWPAPCAACSPSNAVGRCMKYT